MDKTIFSPLQIKVLRVLGRRRLSIEKITQGVYAHKKRPVDSTNGVGQAVRRINRKCKYHKLPWFLNGMGKGRSGKVVWKDQM